MKYRKTVIAAALVAMGMMASPTALATECDDETSKHQSANDGDADSDDVIDHAPFAELLARRVDEEGMVDYAGWKQSTDDRRALATYRRDIATASIGDADRDAQLAFLLNAYNALVIADVIDRWPVDNVVEEEGFFDEKLHAVAGARLTLDRLEKAMIHGRFDDPRTHFAVVCAARSCPRLRTTVFTAANVEEKLDAMAAEYVPRVTSIGDDGRVETSQLFEWYGDTFRRDADSVAQFLVRYVDDDELQRALEDGDVEVEFSEYDWTINAQ